jgi:hypothetical protein
MNMVFAGDFWQLPPVRGHSIFSNPFIKGTYDTLEQKMLKMFWDPEDIDSIQKTTLLTEQMRTKDKWLRAVLDADRYGQESWEMYCFTHGLPTRNPGSWMPGEAQPLCGRPACAKLATEVWPKMWRSGEGKRDNWKLRLEKECEVCAKERQRRCCVLREDVPEDLEKLQSETFATAAYVHPFRHPSYHATQLRALVFAKSKKKRLLWITATTRLKPTTCP